MSKEVISNTENSVWHFPAEHNVKAIGFSHESVDQAFESILHDMKLSYKPGRKASKKSSNGKYISVTFNVTFTNEDEVKTLYTRLHAHPKIIQSL